MVFERKQEIHRLKFTHNKKNISLLSNVITSQKSKSKIRKQESVT